MARLRRKRSLLKLIMCKVDVKDSQLMLTNKDVDNGVAAKTELNKCKLSEGDVMQFRMECRALLFAVTAKILERSSLKVNLVRFVPCLVPNVMLRELQQHTTSADWLRSC